MTIYTKILFLWLFFSGETTASTLQVSIPKMPVHSEQKNKGVLVDFATNLAEKLGHEINIQLVPFARSMKYVTENKVDFHLPLIKPAQLNNDEVDFIYSDETIFYVNFVLYTNKNKPLNMANLASYAIETDSAHLAYFPQLKMGSNCILCSLKKIQHQMTDGYIFADSATDPLLIENKHDLPDIHREFYQRFEVKVIFPKNEKGQAMNKKISAIIAQMRASGELDTLLHSINQPFKGWQIAL